ncbi:putative bifunctional diguanylate cyclase/phosphodiesterase [Oxalobacteraceae bacterium A2-2]
MQTIPERPPSDARLAAALESISDAVILLDRDWRLTYLNAEAERLAKVLRADVLGRSMWEVFPEAVDTTYYRAYRQAMDTGIPVAFEEHYAPLDLWTEIRAYPSEQGLAIYFRDIGRRKASEAEIHSLAFYDTLTGLPNRQLLLDRIAHAIVVSGRSGHPGALLFIDLDNFKSINDTLGHDQGDTLLRDAAARMAGAVRASDTVARFGGDEFVVLLEDAGQGEAEVAAVAQEVARKVLLAFEAPFMIAGGLQHTTPSMGVALFDGAASADDTLRRADLAMYQAKAAGRNNAVFYDTQMQARVSARVGLESDLRRALAQDEFELHYQPQAAIDGRLLGVEALLRWRHPVRGLVAQTQFIPIAEEMGLIVPIGRWVLQRACRQLAVWGSDPRTSALRMSVNISAPQFHRPDFVEQVLQVLAETGAPPQQLVLEVTESMLLNDIEGVIARMRRLKEAGVCFALDDFGTGYSSLSYLHRLPLDQIKIDKSFIWNAFNEVHGSAIVRIIVALGRALKMSVMAEGVETARQLSLVLAEGCQSYQGFLYSKPLQEGELAGFIAAR